MRTSMEVEVSTRSLSYSLSRMDYKELVDLVLTVDLLIADCGFTEELVTKLVRSLKSDSADISMPFIDWSKVS